MKNHSKKKPATSIRVDFSQTAKGKNPRLLLDSENKRNGSEKKNDSGRQWHKYKQDILEKMGDFSSIYADLKKQRPPNDEWVSALCPFHSDHRPSFSYNTESGGWICQAGCGEGSVFDYLMKKTGKGFKEVLLELGDKLGLPRPESEKPLRPPIREDLVKGWVKNLRADEEVCRWLRDKRGLSDKTLRKYKIGWDPKRQRYTLPVRDELGNVVNVRLYSAKKKPKILNYTEGRHRYGTPPRLYGLDELVKSDGRQVILCEGEWDRLVLQQEGFAAVTGTHGASTFRSNWLPHFKGKDVVILFDCDDGGRAGAEKAAKSIAVSGAASVKIVTLPLSGGRDDKDVTDYFLQGCKTAPDLQVLIDQTEPYRPKSGKPQIVVNDMQMEKLVQEAWSAILQINNPPQTYLHGGHMARVFDQNAVPYIEEMNDDGVRVLLYRVADWHARCTNGIRDSKPPRELARDLLANPHLDLPVIEGVVTTPVFSATGTLVDKPGYDPETRFWYHQMPGFKLENIPAHPSPGEIDRARSIILEDLFVDFPFVQQSDRAHAVAALFLPFVRRMIEGCTPIHLMEAPAPGSGKSLLAELIWLVALGRSCEPTTITRNEEESRKKITSILRRGLPVVVIDNVTDGLRSGQLSAALTADVWSDRILGKSSMVVLPNRATWLVTANNPELSNELSRRCVRIRIDSGIERPWLRTEFKHSVIRIWAKDNRCELVWASLILIQAWLAEGMPRGDKILGSFESWSAILGGILNVAGIPGFLEDAEEFYENADSEGAEWRAFVYAWWDSFGNDQVVASDLLDLAEKRDLIGFAISGNTIQSQKMRLGKALTRQRDRRFGDYRIVTELNRHTKTKVYRLVVAQEEFLRARRGK